MFGTWVTIANFLTLTRILVLPFALLTLHYRSWPFVFLTILWMFLSDFLDGFIARKRNEVTLVGSILDPIADKIVVIGLFLFFYQLEICPLYYLALVLFRDISQLSVVPVLLFWKKIIFYVKPKKIPKWGTALNFCLLALYGYYYFANSESYKIPESIRFLEVLLLMVSSIIEVYILYGFWPRFIAIYQGHHDTFE